MQPFNHNGARETEQAQPAAPSPTGDEAAQTKSDGSEAPAAGAAADMQKPRGKQGRQWSQSRKREALDTRMILNFVKLSHPYKGGQGHNRKKGHGGGRGGQGGGGRGANNA
ncbi:uncharacterized protein LOC125501165 [Athalia rosae]|uniref:uncharacterized protein LOC125501165 n=1 Tax=Athalia rosae TaxID=37344 RepID=UPI00203379D9|nr:uncharacterized protein LOC125501165 [Athalia rosae]